MLPELHDLGQEGRDVPRLPLDLERELAAGTSELFPESSAAPAGRPPSWTSLLAGIATLASLFGVSVAVIALIIAVSARPSDNDPQAVVDRPLVLGNSGLNTIDCVNDTLQIFVPAENSPAFGSGVRLKDRSQSITVLPRAVQGGYYLALGVKRGVIHEAGDAQQLELIPGDELTVRIEGHAVPELVDVRGQLGPDGEGEEECDPTPRHLLLP